MTSRTENEQSTAERSQRADLAQVIERRAGDIRRRWLDRVQADTAGRSVDPTKLPEAISDYLVRLVEALRDESALASGVIGAWVGAADDHAVTRVRSGFDISQLVGEFVLLRRVLTNVAGEEGLLPAGGQGERLAEMLEAAIASSVGSYVESRDEAVRRNQAEHVAFLTHELRNPLGTAMMAASQLRRSLGLDLGPKNARVLELLETAHRRLRDLIARRAIELQGDEVHAESTPEAGCHFWLRLPKDVERKGA